MKKFLVCSLVVMIVLSFTTIPTSFGHGLSSETLPSVKVGDIEVALFAQIIPNPFVEGKQLALELFDTATSNTTSQTTYSIKAIKNNKIIFEHTFQRDNAGLVIDLIPKKSGEASVEETGEVSPLESLYGIEKVVKATSPMFSENGLYLFEVKILTVGSFQNKLQNPISYNFGLSFPDEKDIELKDKKLGNIEMRLISYYDQISDFSYDSEKNTFNFAIPFDWSAQTINQTIAVHEEVIFPKDSKFLMSSDFSTFLNGQKLDDKILTIDDYTRISHRIIHLVINQSDLLQLYSKQNENAKNMEFVLVPIDSKSAEFSIPTWIKSNAKWWSDNTISDDDFSSGIEFLIKQGIFIVPQTESGQVTGKEIPSWIKNNAGWWADGLISDEDFVKGIQYLIEQKIVKVS